MKNYLLISALTVLFFTACNEDPEPYPYTESYPKSDFEANYIVEPGDKVYFDNYSQNADFFEWNFGDNTVSNEVNPVHSYTSEGIYEAVLYARDRSGYESESSINIEVYYTTLEVEVAIWNPDYIIDYVVEGATVYLYENYQDWYDRVNHVGVAVSDENGIAFFNDVDDKAYYIDVISDKYTNEAAKFEELDLIQTLPLEYTYNNYFTAWVEEDLEGISSKKAERGDIKGAISASKPIKREAVNTMKSTEDNGREKVDVNKTKK